MEALIGLFVLVCGVGGLCALAFGKDGTTKLAGLACLGMCGLLVSAVV